MRLLYSFLLKDLILHFCACCMLYQGSIFVVLLLFWRPHSNRCSKLFALMIDRYVTSRAHFIVAHQPKQLRVNISGCIRMLLNELQKKKSFKHLVENVVFKQKYPTWKYLNKQKRLHRCWLCYYLFYWQIQKDLIYQSPREWARTYGVTHVCMCVYLNDEDLCRYRAVPSWTLLHACQCQQCQRAQEPPSVYWRFIEN